MSKPCSSKRTPSGSLAVEVDSEFNYLVTVEVVKKDLRNIPEDDNKLERRAHEKLETGDYQSERSYAQSINNSVIFNQLQTISTSKTFATSVLALGSMDQ
ncbi:hypothetical protein PAAG_01166 [Paracoccidioides lutzii Pb01]|uniref:Uncharacterized protein n=1 Tax=Paracoccidioides lutzii (strain ATCC MYA-826 / Pb01) TaxID=502779 RepID=C1GRM1_PARBA|nr:hypothetical protein PAAG_01166 [Paracoccidioides lutzii Pb01]EEH38245.2 hypothetical protein PAAG_01166 [Paracoccidioides lutzii Pb01]